MLRPVIMIGCGGAGNQIVRYTRDAVERRLKNVGWTGGIPRAWQFIGIDSSRLQSFGEVSYLPNSDYLDISVQDATYQEFDMALQARFGPHDAQPSVFRELMGWRPNPNQLAVPIQFSSGQYRPTGRALGLFSLQHHVPGRIQHAFNACIAGGPELVEVSRCLGGVVPPGELVPQPIVMVIGSMAGGTGSGIMLDIVELIRKTDVNGQFPALIALSPDVFESHVSGSPQSDRMNANSASFMAELLNAYWDNEIPNNGLIPPMVLAHRRGPHSVYVVGRRNLDGQDLVSPWNVFVAVSKTLAAITTSERVQLDFVHYQTVDWTNRAAANAGGYGFAPQHFPAVSSSFGSTSISIGRERFREYMKKLLLRSLGEHLTNGFGEDAFESFDGTMMQSVMPDENVKSITQKKADQFIEDCGLQVEQMSQEFVFPEKMRALLAEISQWIMASLPTSELFRSEQWNQVILSAADEYRTLNREGKIFEVESHVQKWSSAVTQKVLKLINDSSAKSGLPFALNVLEQVRIDVLKHASEMREKALTHRELMTMVRHGSRAHLHSGKRRINISSQEVQRSVEDISKSIVYEWSADVYESLANALETLGQSVLIELSVVIRDSFSRVNEMVGLHVGDWPKVDGWIPPLFSPGPNEYVLEGYYSWPQRARELLQQSLEKSEGREGDSIKSAIASIIRGGFRDPESGQSFSPLIWIEENGTEPTWKAGKRIGIKAADSLDELSTRVDTWLSLPELAIHQLLNEGLSAYLSPINAITSKPIEDHLVRLMQYSHVLNAALNNCRPQFEVDYVMNATVHPHEILCTLGIDGFPFQVGHPARQLTEQVIQGFLGTTDPVDWAFSSSDSESVTITSFLKYPVNPSVIRSATEPLERTRSGITNPSQHFHMWQWTRSRPLRQFVPLPQELILSAIRGFAVARALGVVSAEVEDQNVIAIHSGEVKFPKFLLTLTDRNNLLSSLLESMVLAFGDIPTMGSAAFDAYEALISYGSSEGQSSEFQVGGLLRHFLETGDYDGVKVVDHRRAESVFGDHRHKRAEKIFEYLERNIERFEHLERTGPDSRSWRNSIGTVEPTDTLTQELLPELRRGYGQVLDAVRNWQRPSDYLV